MTTPEGPPDPLALARDWAALVAGELAAMAEDRELRETWQALLALWAGAAAALPGGVGRDERAAPPRAAAAAPASAAGDAAGPGAAGSGGALGELAGRLAELERRLAELERGVAAGGARPRSRGRRGKPGAGARD